MLIVLIVVINTTMVILIMSVIMIVVMIIIMIIMILILNGISNNTNRPQGRIGRDCKIWRMLTSVTKQESAIIRKTDVETESEVGKR